MLRDHWIILDVATAPIPHVDRYLEGTVKAPKNYGPDAAAKYVEEKTAERIQSAALDIDLSRVIGLGLWDRHGCSTRMAETDEEEVDLLTDLATLLDENPTIVTFNGSAFDLPVLMRRARYLGVSFPRINLDRYRSPHVDLAEELSDRNPQRRRSLEFYVRRHGWDDLQKPLSGAEESCVPESGRWDDLAASLLHDLTATWRLAVWWGAITKTPRA